VVAVGAAWARRLGPCLPAAGRSARARRSRRIRTRRGHVRARVPRRRKALIALAIGYLATPLDLVPDFIPVAGQLDDAVIVALVLRHLLRGAPTGLVEELWPGRPESLRVVLALAYGRRRSPA
jgi:uncharacterized membrane protein YkvA (DUF1232 family)